VLLEDDVDVEDAAESDDADDVVVVVEEESIEEEGEPILLLLSAEVLPLASSLANSLPFTSEASIPNLFAILDTCS
jgi:hypothetical protein